MPPIDEARDAAGQKLDLNGGGGVARRCALRIHACALGEPGFLVYDIRCISTHLVARSLALAVNGPGSEDARIVFRSSREIAPLAHTLSTWLEAEYAVVVPDRLASFSIACTSGVRKAPLAEIAVTPDTTRHLLDDYYSALCNPFADSTYPDWLTRHSASQEVLDAQRSTDLSSTPLISLVVPVFRTPPNYLATMLDSVIAQTYSNWELVVVNASPDDKDVAGVLRSKEDPRIRIIGHPENDGINGNTNVGIAASLGDYVGFIDHDDFIEPDTLFEYAREIERHPDVDVLYCDEDSFEEPDRYLLPLFKPDFNRDLLYSNDYAIHLEMVSRRIIESTERSGDETNGAQDYDLMLRGVEKARRISHIPRVLYHWRKHEASTNAGNSNSKPYVETACMTVLKGHFHRRGIPMEIEREPVPFTYRLLAIPPSRRSMTVIIDSVGRDASHVSALADGFPDDTEVIATRRSGLLADRRNAAARMAKGELLLFLGSDVTPLDNDALEAMASYFERPEVGMVGPQLIYPDGQRHNSGIVLRSDGGITFVNQGIPSWDGGYNGRASRPCNWTALSHAAQLVRRDTFLGLGGYSVDYANMEYSSVDFCLKLRSAGKVVTYTPFARMSHAEPSQVPLSPLPQKQLESIMRDRRHLGEAWPETKGWSDPSYNANLDDTSPYFHLGT